MELSASARCSTVFHWQADRVFCLFVCGLQPYFSYCLRSLECTRVNPIDTPTETSQ